MDINDDNKTGNVTNQQNISQHLTDDEIQQSRVSENTVLLSNTINTAKDKKDSPRKRQSSDIDCNHVTKKCRLDDILTNMNDMQNEKASGTLNIQNLPCHLDIDKSSLLHTGFKNSEEFCGLKSYDTQLNTSQEAASFGTKEIRMEIEEKFPDSTISEKDICLLNKPEKMILKNGVLKSLFPSPTAIGDSVKEVMVFNNAKTINTSDDSKLDKHLEISEGKEQNFEDINQGIKNNQCSQGNQIKDLDSNVESFGLLFQHILDNLNKNVSFNETTNIRKNELQTELYHDSQTCRHKFQDDPMITDNDSDNHNDENIACQVNRDSKILVRENKVNELQGEHSGDTISEIEHAESRVSKAFRDEIIILSNEDKCVKEGSNSSDVTSQICEKQILEKYSDTSNKNFQTDEKYPATKVLNCGNGITLKYEEANENCRIKELLKQPKLIPKAFSFSYTIPEDPCTLATKFHLKEPTVGDRSGNVKPCNTSPSVCQNSCIASAVITSASECTNVNEFLKETQELYPKNLAKVVENSCNASDDATTQEAKSNSMDKLLREEPALRLKNGTNMNDNSCGASTSVITSKSKHVNIEELLKEYIRNTQEFTTQEILDFIMLHNPSIFYLTALHVARIFLNENLRRGILKYKNGRCMVIQNFKATLNGESSHSEAKHLDSAKKL